MNTYPENPPEDLICECGRQLPCRHCESGGEGSGASPCSPDRVPEADRKMIFHTCQKLNAVLGLNEQEFEWLASLGAEVPKANA
jgi:hypothetical protein